MAFGGTLDGGLDSERIPLEAAPAVKKNFIMTLSDRVAALVTDVNFYYGRSFATVFCGNITRPDGRIQWGETRPWILGGQHPPKIEQEKEFLRRRIFTADAHVPLPTC